MYMHVPSSSYVLQIILHGLLALIVFEDDQEYKLWKLMKILQPSLYFPLVPNILYKIIFSNTLSYVILR